MSHTYSCDLSKFYRHCGRVVIQTAVVIPDILMTGGMVAQWVCCLPRDQDNRDVPGLNPPPAANPLVSSKFDMTY